MTRILAQRLAQLKAVRLKKQREPERIEARRWDMGEAYAESVSRAGGRLLVLM